jgi:hypothetical protein
MMLGLKDVVRQGDILHAVSQLQLPSDGEPHSHPRFPRHRDQRGQARAPHDWSSKGGFRRKPQRGDEQLHSWWRGGT